MKVPIRVCLVSPLPPPAGGIARWTSTIVNHAEDRADVDLTVVNTALRWRTVQQSSALARITAGVPQLLSSAMALLAGAVKRKFDVVHINTSAQFSVVRDLTLTLLARLFRIPVVYHLRFGRLPQVAARQGLEWHAMALVMRLSRWVITIDRRSEDAVRTRLPRVPVVRVPNCIDIEQTATLPHNPEPGAPRYILFAGWVIPAKGVEELLSAWRDAASPGWRLVVAGSYDDAYLESIDSQPGEDPSVEFLGEVPHERVLELMAGCEVFVLPSHTEGFPNAVLEAMSLGKCVLATDVGAIGEMLDEECGVVVAARDTRAIREGLSAVVDDPTLRRRLGQRARAKVVAEYALKETFDRYQELWRTAVERRR
jgi:glycosyltransferase involved in cell wall biosynthesis